MSKLLTWKPKKVWCRAPRMPSLAAGAAVVAGGAVVGAGEGEGEGDGLGDAGGAGCFTPCHGQSPCLSTRERKQI